MDASRLQRSRNVLFIALAATLAGCGGGGGGGTVAPPPATAATAATGIFTDAPVVGLDYATSSGQSGTTNAEGKFQFMTGDTVTFTAAGVVLGSSQPTVASDGTAVVTPLNLVNATSVTDPKVTPIAQLLSTLNSISAANGTAQSGTLVIPTDSTLNSQLAALKTPADSLTTTQIQGVLDSVYGAGKYMVTTATTAQTSLQQGINSQGIVGTTWSATCSGCNQTVDALFYFQPNGTFVGFNKSGDFFFTGSWSGSTSANGGVSMTLTNSDGSYLNNATIAAGAATGSGDILASDGTTQGSLTFTEIVGTTASTLSGGWYVTFTPTAAEQANGNNGASGYTIAAPDGTFFVIMGNEVAFNGTWDPSNGQGSASLTDPDGRADTVSVDFSKGTGVVSSNGQTIGNVTLSRAGSFALVPASSSGSSGGSSGSGSSGSSGGIGSTVQQLTLSLNVQTTFANIPPTANQDYGTGIAYQVVVTDSNGNQVANAGAQAFEDFSSLFGGVPVTVSNVTSVQYPQGVGVNYSVTIPANQPQAKYCSVSGGGSGSVLDANSGTPSSYPTVTITCNQ
jgi:hypothetical protein